MPPIYQRRWKSLNALSGIGGVQTKASYHELKEAFEQVLMPCRALEAFRPTAAMSKGTAFFSLNALSGIGGVQTEKLLIQASRDQRDGS